MKWNYAVIAATIFAIGGCTSLNARHDAPTIPTTKTAKKAIEVWGRRGTKDGEFYEPRAIAVGKKFAYIVDSSGRIHTWTRDGKFVRAWQAPSIEKGRPEGVAIFSNGDLAVTDTHYSRILIYNATGKLLSKFGTYGTQKGGFLLVTGVCIDKDDNIYAADYGGESDRVSKWTKTGKLLASWSGHGSGPRQFRRPCGLAISQEGDLLVADIANHRVQRLDAVTGKCKNPSALGPRGHDKGQLTYPYGVAVDKNGFIYTVEYSEHRVQKWTPEGKFADSWGSPGRQVGQLANPWGLAVDETGAVYVADTQNHRIQKFRF